MPGRQQSRRQGARRSGHHRGLRAGHALKGGTRELKRAVGLLVSTAGRVDFLGFTHYWAKSRLGNWVLKRKTAKKRVRRAKQALWQWCRHYRHRPLKEQYQVLCQKVRGHYQYYAIRGNYQALESLLASAHKAWRYWLSRRSRESYIPWDKFERVLEAFPLPRPRIIHQV